MSPDTQSKLLRAIQERKVRPVGSSTEIPVNVRVIASTNRNPEQAVHERHFREDLYYRLQATVLRVPRLQDRSEDIPLLAEHFINLFNEKQIRPNQVDGIEDDALRTMGSYAWPGNVRELSNAIEGAFIFGKSPTIMHEDLPVAIRGSLGGIEEPLRTVGVGSFADAECEISRRALEMAGGNKVHAAQVLNISRKRLYAKIAKYGLPAEAGAEKLNAALVEFLDRRQRS